MYTYQYQDLTLYKGVTTGGDANSFKWYVKKKGVVGDGDIIPSATSSIYRVPSNYRNSNDTLIFTCEYTNSASTPQKISTEIEFIKLNEANKIQIDGADYYWVELDVAPSYTGSSNTSGKLKVLATNLGVETANAADLGDLYQWGRIADGHQTIGWSYTGTTTRTVAFDTATSANQLDKATGTITYDANSPALEGGTPFLQVTDTDHKGKFVYNSIVWQASESSTADKYIWATSAYAKTANDPCPSGWHVPSNYEIIALSTGTRIDNIPSGSGIYPVTYNFWRFPSAGFGNSAHVGGIVVTQGKDKNGTSRLFLPAASYRLCLTGELDNVGVNGHYASSTVTLSGTIASFGMGFNSGVFNTNLNQLKAYGLCVRCVAE
jgi:hypothetical protein